MAVGFVGPMLFCAARIVPGYVICPEYKLEGSLGHGRADYAIVLQAFGRKHILIWSPGWINLVGSPFWHSTLSICNFVLDQLEAFSAESSPFLTCQQQAKALADSRQSGYPEKLQEAAPFPASGVLAMM